MNLDSIYGFLEESPGLPGGDTQASEWDVREELWRRELAEVRARAAQLEKTMRWWSDCTATWREKWGKVRAERNRAREEGRQLRLQLDLAVKELSGLKKKQSGCPQSPAPREPPVRGVPTGQEEGLIINPLRIKEMKLNLDSLDLFKNDGSENSVMKAGLGLEATGEPSENETLDISALRVPLDEFQKILWKEREIRSSMEKEVECLESALSIWKQKYEELRESKLKSTKELARLQTSKWDQSEILETEKQELERENRKLRRQVQEMEALLYRRRRLGAETQGLNLQAALTDPQDPDQELLELQQAYQKLSRQYQAKIEELMHANRRADQSEAEVKKLRFQVEELRRELKEKESELDALRHQIHKLQNALDERKDTNDSLEIELQRLKNREDRKHQKNVPVLRQLPRGSHRTTLLISHCPAFPRSITRSSKVWKT